MLGPLTRRYLYSADEIDQYARDILQVAEDMELPISLMLLSLCRAITIIGSEEELDVACLLIDELRDDDDDTEYDYDIEDEEEDD